MNRSTVLVFALVAITCAALWATDVLSSEHAGRIAATASIAIVVAGTLRRWKPLRIRSSELDAALREPEPPPFERPAELERVERLLKMRLTAADEHFRVRPLLQDIAAFGFEIFGMYGQLMTRSHWNSNDGSVARSLLWSSALTIAGGTSEIQRNIIAARGLGLPRQ